MMSHVHSSSSSLLSLSDDLLITCLDWLNVFDIGKLNVACSRVFELLKDEQLWYQRALHWSFSSYPSEHSSTSITCDRGILESRAIPQTRKKRERQASHIDHQMTDTEQDDSKDEMTTSHIDDDNKDEISQYDWHHIIRTVHSRQSSHGTATLVMDMGSCTCTVGLGGSPHAPRTFPAIQYVSHNHIYIGHDIRMHTTPTSHYPITLPLLHANETGDWSRTEEIWKYGMERIPEMTYRNGKILICDQLLGGEHAIQRMLERRYEIASMIFELNDTVPSIAFCNDALLALLSVGRTSGIVFHIGFTHSCVAIIIDGEVKNITNLPYHGLGGQSHSRLLLQSAFIRHSDYEITVPDMFTFVPALKRACYVAMNPRAESTKPISEIEMTVRLEDERFPGDMTPAPPPVVLEEERFQASELFFISRFPLLIIRALRTFPSSHYPTLTSNIVLSGRSTCLHGFSQRLEYELKQVMPEGTPINVIPTNEACTWIGGSVLSQLSGLDDMCITRDAFAQYGIEAVRRRAEF